MKNKSALLFLLFAGIPLANYACELCRENQPRLLKGITHGTGPQGNTDYIIIWTAVLIVSVTLFLSIKYLVWPKESAADHIKYSIVE